MQSCCLAGCESYKYIAKQKIGYFKFPLDNKSLLQKWLSQIRLPNWIPMDFHQICSTHFHVDDIDFSHKYPVLKKDAVPMIFPLKHFQSVFIEDLCTDSIIKPREEDGSEILEYDKYIYDNEPYSNLLITPNEGSTKLFESGKDILVNKLCKDSSENQKKRTIPRIIESKKNLVLNKSNSNPTVRISPSVILLCSQTKPNFTCGTQTDVTSSNLEIKKIPLNVDRAPHNSQISASNPYIVIVSDKQNTSLPLKNRMTINNHPVLRIQIDKKINSDCIDNTLMNQYSEMYTRSNVMDEERSFDSTKNNYSHNVEVNCMKSSEIVVFCFDSATKKIKVHKKNKTEVGYHEEN